MGCSSGPWAWSDDAVSCVAAPAGLVRLTGNQYSIFAEAGGTDDPGIAAAAAYGVGDYHLGTAASYRIAETLPDTMEASVSAARTVRGDPVGFMEGVFGPSISLGGSLGFIGVEGDTGDSERMLYAHLGFQFSVFPTVAIGANMSHIRLGGDALQERSLDYGFTTIFDKRFRGHFAVTDGNASVGFELGVRDWLTVRSGSDGSSWNSGISIGTGSLSIDWAVSLNGSDCRQGMGITLATGGGS